MADRLDEVGEAELRRRIDDALAARCRVLEVDCSRVQLIGRPALATLTAAKARLEAHGGVLLVTRRSPAFTAAARSGGFAELLRSDGLFKPAPTLVPASPQHGPLR